MKTRLEETNKMRKLMGLPLLNEQETVGNFVDKVSGRSDSLSNLGNMPIKSILPQVVGALVGLGVGVISKVKTDKRRKQLSNLLNDINTLLEQDMSPAEIRCLSKNLASKGKITKLNSPTNSIIHGSSQKRKGEILNAIVDCVGEDRAEDISDKLNGYITRIEEEKQKIKDEEKSQKNITSIK
jgi:hypothetical protein